MLCYFMLLESEDKKADFLALYEANRDYLWTMTGRYFSDQDRRADAVQDAWTAVAKYFPKISALPCEFQTPYLLTIVKHTCVAILNKEKKYAPMPEEPEVAETLIGSTWDPDPAGLSGDARRAAELIADLPKNYRAVLEARLVLEKTNSEVASELGIPMSTASTLFERGKKLLAKKLMEEGICYE